MTDDQDELLNSTHPHFMPALNRHLGQRGTRLSQFTVSTPVCCPARVALLTGQYAHCANVTDNGGVGGGFAAFHSNRLDRDWLPGWLEKGGYDTHLIGKFLNGYQDNLTYTAPGYYPKGWTTFDAITNDRLYMFTNSCFIFNGGARECFNGLDQYQTDIVRDKAIARLRAAAAAGRPFLLYLAPTAPHREQVRVGDILVFTNPRPATRHRTLYAADNGDNFNISSPVFSANAGLDAGDLTYLRSLYVARLRSLRAIDEMLDAIVNEVKALGLDSNTHIMYTSDNGFHLGQFGLGEGKLLPVEEDIMVPLFIAGPGIPAGVVLAHQANMVDLAPTILALAGLPLPRELNGAPLPLNEQLTREHEAQLLAAAVTVGARAGQGASPSGLVANVWAAAGVATAGWRREGIILEAWRVESIAAINPNVSFARVFKVLRICTPYQVFPDSGVRNSSSAHQPGARSIGQEGVPCYKYAAWCSRGARQLFDLSTDPYEIRDRYSEAPAAVLDRLDGVLSALAHCKGAECRNPYALLHPGAQPPVASLEQAMQPQHDAMYASLAKLRFNRCLFTYQPGNEPTWSLGIGPQPGQGQGAP